MRVVRIDPQDALPDLAPCYDSILQFWCANTPGAPPWKLMKAQARQESAFNPLAKSPTGPVGLFQFTRLTWEQYSPGDDRRDIFKASGAAVRMMRDLYSWAQTHGVSGEQIPRFALGAYNQGQGNVTKSMQWAATQGADPANWTNIPPGLASIIGPGRTAEVVNYVNQIMAFWNEYENPAATA